MRKVKCDYCGAYYEGEYQSALENGSPACPECVAKEEENEKQNREVGGKNNETT